MTKTTSGNLFSAIDRQAAEEDITTLLARPNLRIERIVSTGQVSAPGFWYDQDDDEWVMLVAGAARIEIAGEREYALSAGDHLLLPAHCRHRVSWTDPGAPTIWLAVHFAPQMSG